MDGISKNIEDDNEFFENLFYDNKYLECLRTKSKKRKNYNI